MNRTLWDTWIALAQEQPAKTVLVEAATGQHYSAEALHRFVIETEKTIFAGEPTRPPQPIIVFCLPNGLRWFSVFLAIQKAGGIAVPLDISTPEAAQAAAAEALGASHLISPSKIEHFAAPHPLSNPPPPETAVIKMTSGSTGTPAPLFFAPRSLLADGANIIATMGIRPDDVNFAAIPLGHSYGLGNLVLPLLIQGTPVITSAQYLPHVLAEEIARFRPTLFPGVPTHFKAWAQSLIDPDKLATVRLFLSAGAPLKAEWARLFTKKYGKKIHNFYGSSETGGITFDQTGDATLSARSAGTPLTGVTVELTSGNKVRVTSQAAGATGKEPAEEPCGTYELPDTGAWNSLGELVLTGRQGTIIKIGGRRVNLAEIERFLTSHPQIHDAVVFPPNDEEKKLRAAIETPLGRKEIHTLLATHAPPWKIPRKLLIRERLPRTPRGKLDRQKILAMFKRPPL